MERVIGIEPTTFSLGSNTQWILSTDGSDHLQKPSDTVCTKAVLNSALITQELLAEVLTMLVELPLTSEEKAAVLRSLI
jgi:hypothetical protein